MTHNENCECKNCEAKGKPIREIYLADVTPEELAEAEVWDWIEGIGFVDSLAMQKYIRKYGFLMIKIGTDQAVLIKKWRERNDNQARKINGLRNCTTSYCKMHNTYPTDNEPCWQCVNTRTATLNNKIKTQVDGGPVCCSMCDMKKQIHLLKIGLSGYKATIRSLKNKLLKDIQNNSKRYADKDQQINMLMAENQKLADIDIQNELQREKIINKSSFQTIDGLGAEVERLTKEKSGSKNELELVTRNRDAAIDQIAKYWQKICDLEDLLEKSKEQIYTALESRDADWQRIKELNAENDSYSERVHSLEEENGRYFEQICNLQNGLSNVNKLIKILEATKNIKRG